MKVAFIIIGVLVLAVIVLSIVIHFERKKIRKRDEMIDGLNELADELENEKDKLKGELEIERKHNHELAKKLADISCMSIDDVLHELQDGHTDGLSGD